MGQAPRHPMDAATPLVAAAMLLCCTVGSAAAQSRSDCEAGIAAARSRLATVTDAGQRAELNRAVRIGERELGEQQYDECMDALEDAGITAAGNAPAAREAAGTPEADERVGADTGLPVTVEDAFVPSPGEAEVKVGFFYDHMGRPGISGGDDDAEGDDEGGDRGGKRFGRHLFTPGAEAEIGIAPGLAATLAASYSLGNAQEAKSGEIEVGAKWNFLPLRGLGPALTLSGELSVPYGYAGGDARETRLTLLGSQPLGSGADAPFLHLNLSWSHTFHREEDSRANRFAGALGVALPVAESTALIADVVHEQLEDKGRINNLIEAGVRQLLPGSIVLGAGIGAGFGGSVTNFRALASVQKSF